MRKDILDKGIGLYMPNQETVEECVDKGKSTEIWMREGIKVPHTIIVNDENDLKRAFDNLVDNDGNIWLRSTIGGSGKGALP